MKPWVTTFASLLLATLVAMPALAQEAGDYRTRDSGDWSDAQIWESYNGSNWAAIASPPSGSETITVIATEERADSVFIDTEVTISGTLINQGIVEADSNLVFSDGGAYEHDRDEGKIPVSIWEEGSTMRMTGVVATAPDDRSQNYYHVVFNTPDLLSNLNMDLNGVTISGDIRVIDSGLGRWYLTSALANESATVEILGDVMVEGGAFAVQGTSNVNTTFVVNHYGNVDVTGGNFSVSRGSQGLGTTTWYLHEGDFSMDNATTQSSTITPEGAAFVFTKDGVQTLTLGGDVDFSSLPIEVEEGTTLVMGASTLAGSGHFRLHEGATLSTTLPGGLATIFDLVEAPVTLEDNASFIFDGSEAQVTSEQMPTVVDNLTIDNAAGVTLSQETTINGILLLRAGTFDNTTAFTLGESGEVVFDGGSLVVPVSNDALDGELPRALFVTQNYPNPFNPSTVIQYGLPAAAEVTVSVYNLLGQQVLSVQEGLKAAGVHAVTLDASGFPSGLYIYRVEAGSHSVSKRMVLLE